MSFTIDPSICIGCDRCRQSCPTGAIQSNGSSFQIEPNICNNCVGSYSTPQCAAFCPTNDGCIPNDFWGKWFDKYNRLTYRLHNPQQAKYWERWFEVYAQKISQLIAN
ncbi:4Fe-4S binding protein [Candidatus Gracilibacteria bacterium]|nr:4Fe-4S binding protein [Candidatus Gracilibacteria bacterium]NJM88454.1 4Fe-4S binding protein [Hydrococcus sp. RU_2_2]NJP19754.1 4Fe-4S binding protein [Hydrococcus sp. CRU_1_1]NJQ98581.1 4Fe-4S binding protein [Hydrococcus sp. CSU_1_8]